MKKNLLQLTLIWATVLFLFIPVAPIIMIWALYGLWKEGKSRQAFLFLLCTPFIILPIYNVSKAHIDYSNGEATIGFLGYPSDDYSNVDAELRLRSNPEGVPTGTEYFTMDPYNATVKTLIRNKGFQKGSYTGFLPTKVEVNALIQNGDTKQARVSMQGDKLSIELESQLVNLDLKAQPSSICYHLLKLPLAEAALYVFKNGCLVIALNDKWTYSIDVEKGVFLSHFEG